MACLDPPVLTVLSAISLALTMFYFIRLVGHTICHQTIISFAVRLSPKWWICQFVRSCLWGLKVTIQDTQNVLNKLMNTVDEETEVQHRFAKVIHNNWNLHADLHIEDSWANEVIL